MPSAFESLLRKEVQQFIRDHENDDEQALLLKHKTILGLPASLIATQIADRRKARFKLPTFYQAQNILFPPSVNLEQCSSETTAKYKADEMSSINFLPRRQVRVLDLTGGFGVDTFFFSKVFEHVDYVEPSRDLFNMVNHNHSALGAKNISHHNTTAEEFLRSTNEYFDLVYIDPSRRKSNQKVFKLADCDPDVVSLLDLIFSKTNNLLIKASPLHDIHQGIRELNCVKKVFVVAVNNECKELLYLCGKNFLAEPPISAVNLAQHKSEFSFLFSEENNLMVSFSDPQRYLYEPNAAILKAGAFKLIAEKFGIQKIEKNTHLYTSKSLIPDFPGRTFEMRGEVKPESKALFFPSGIANVFTRNYPLSPAEIKRKYRLHDGGDEDYLIGFSGVKKKYMLAAKRIFIQPSDSA